MASSDTISPSARVGGRLVLEDRILPGWLRIEDGRIVAVEPDAAKSCAPYICPGCVDTHVHGWGGYDAMGGPDALSGMARALLRHGITAFLPTAVAAPLETLVAFADDVRGWTSEAPADGAEPLGFNLEGLVEASINLLRRVRTEARPPGSAPSSADEAAGAAAAGKMP